MKVAVGGIELYFDVEGLGLVPEGPRMRQRPVIILIHGGPGSYDHTYLKPDFSRLTTVAQVVHLELRGHGRSDHGDPEQWSVEACARDVHGFCEALGIERPIVFGHSLGGYVALQYAILHPNDPGGLILQSTAGRFDLDRIVEGFRAAGGDISAEVVRRFYLGDFSVGEEFREHCRPLFGPWMPGVDERDRIAAHDELLGPGLAEMRRFDVLGDAAAVACPTLVCTGSLDPVTQVADAQDIVSAIGAERATLRVIDGAGHFPWKDQPDAYWPVIERFVAERGRQSAGGGAPAKP